MQLLYKFRVASTTKATVARAHPVAVHYNRVIYRHTVLARATPDDEVDSIFGALDEEEYREIFDPTNQIPGSYKDAMSSKTELGSAVREACDELDALRGLETDVIQQAEDLLKGIGFKGSLFDAPTED